MANKTVFEDTLGDHDGDNPANWSAGLPRAGYNVQIGEVEACCFSQGYECIQLIIEYDATTVTFDGGDWTFTNDLRLEHGSVFVTDEMTVDGSLYVSDLVDADLTKLSVRYTQADTLEVDVEGLEIGDVVWTSAGTGYYTRMFEVNCRVFDVDGEVRFSQYAPLTIRSGLILRPGAIIDAAGNNPVITIEGDMTATESGSTWLAGTNGCHFIGSGDQAVNLSAVEGTFDPVAINKPSGRVLLQSDLNCVSLDHQAGVFDPNGHVITISGDCTVNPGAKLAESLDGSTWSIGGNLTWQGQEGDRLALRGTATWQLSVVGEAIASYADARFCDASGGSAIDALDGTSVDEGNNLNWLFPPEQPFSIVAGCIYASGAVAGIPVVPTAVAGETFVATAERGVVHA